MEPDNIKEVRIKGQLSAKLRNEELERGTWEDELTNLIVNVLRCLFLIVNCSFATASTLKLH